MSLIINDREFSDEEVVAQYQKRSAEYHEWRLQKAIDFLANKQRVKLYRCEIVEDADVESEYYLPLADDIIARVRALNDNIANDPDLKTDELRAGEFRDRISEIGDDIEVSGPMSADHIFTNIDLEDYLYTYRFDLHLLDWDGDANGRTFPASAALTDDEYVSILALLIDQPNCSFQHLAHLSPKFKNIHEKVSDDLHHYDFGEFAPFCYDHDYAIRMSELRADAQTLLNQLADSNDEYPYKAFLKDFIVNIIVATQTKKDIDPQDKLAKLSELYKNFTQEDNFTAAEQMKNELHRLIDERKLQTPGQIKVHNDNILLELPGGREEIVSFKRTTVAKAIYVFYLRQIERAEQDKKIPRCLSKVELENHLSEIREIYKNLGGTLYDFKHFSDKSDGTFKDAHSSIRAYFKQFFNVDFIRKNYGKCFSIEIMGEKDRYGNSRYGIDLDTSDFDLGWYSIHRNNI